MVLQHDAPAVRVGAAAATAAATAAAPGSAPPSPDAVAALPPGARLLHIGFPKTGTTMAQAAVAAAAAQLAEHGVGTPGSASAQSRAALALLGQRVPWMPTGAGPVSVQHWTAFAGGVRAMPGRVFASSEYLCEADDDAVRRVADDLGRDDLHVVATLRPFGRILPSAWQQYLKSGLTLRYEDWLTAVLAEEPAPRVTPSFWRRHDHGAVVRRWAAELGPERVTVIVPGSDRGLILRALGRLLDLPDGLLQPDGRANRSMSGSEAELFRQVNLRLKRQRLPWSDFGELLRYGAVLRAVETLAATAHDPLPAAPDWAVDRTAELGGRFADEIAASGVRVVGDLDELRVPCAAPSGPPEGTPDGGGQPAVVPLDLAAEALIGTLMRAVHGDALAAGGEVRAVRTARMSPTGLAGVPTKRLATELAGRFPGVVARRTRRALRR